jgi:hypothetical protein
MKNSKKIDLLNSQYDSETLTAAKKVFEVGKSVSVSDFKTILYVAGKLAEINSKLV